jgi:hypothetical protein
VERKTLISVFMLPSCSSVLSDIETSITLTSLSCLLPFVAIKVLFL